MTTYVHLELLYDRTKHPEKVLSYMISQIMDAC